MKSLERPRPSGTFDAKLVHAIFVRGLGARLPASALARIAEAGLDLGQPLSGAYPREVVYAAVSAAAGALFPRVDHGEAHRRLGEAMVRGFASGWKARAMIATARALGPERALAKLLGTHRTPSDFLVIDFRQDGPGRYQVRTNLGAPHPEVLVGLAQAILEVLGARRAEVELAERGEAERLEVRLEAR